MFSWQQRFIACFIKLFLMQKHNWRRMTLISCNLFVKSIFVGLNFELFFSTPHLIEVGSGVLLRTSSYIQVQSNLDYSKCQGPQESFRIIGSSNDRKREFSDIFGKSTDTFIERHCFARDCNFNSCVP